MARRPPLHTLKPMSDTQRLETLELKCMELENTVQALNDQLVQQYRDFQRLVQEMKRLESRIDTVQNDSDAPGDGHEVPPHY
jgi:uncharacterized coiled-coil protein SlyX